MVKNFADKSCITNITVPCIIVLLRPHEGHIMTILGPYSGHSYHIISYRKLPCNIKYLELELYGFKGQVVGPYRGHLG